MGQPIPHLPWTRNGGAPTVATVVATVLKRGSHETVFGGKNSFEMLPSPHNMTNQRRHHASPAPPPTPPPAPRSSSDANASADGSFSGRSSRDEDPLDPSPPLPRSQLGPKPPVNLYHHHRHSHHSPYHHTTAAGIAALAANALFAGNLTLPANVAFTRRQRLRWTQPLPPSPSPPANPPTNDSPHHRRRRNRYGHRNH